MKGNCLIEAMGVARFYLVAYNAVLTVGWAQILLLTLRRITLCDSSSNATDFVPSWVPQLQGHLCYTENDDDLFWWIKIFQTAAFMEIVHAVLRLVSSAVGTTVQQVFSRLMLVWAVVYLFPNVTALPAFAYMVLAWSITEVIRYSWYAAKDLSGAPSFLTWCRYTFFYVLYPLGVTGELILVNNAISQAHARAEGTADPFDGSLAAVYALVMRAMSLLYIPLFPMLYLHMISQRKKQLGTPKPKPVVSEEGIQFPRNAKGERSTLATGQSAFAKSVVDVNTEAAAAVWREKSWRFGYVKHVIDNVQICCQSRDTCVAVCKAGLDFLHTSFEFVRNGRVYTLRDAMQQITETFPDQATLKGSGSRATELVVPVRDKPYPQKCDLKALSGAALEEQLNKWVAQGTIEDSARAAIELVAKSGTKYLDLSNRYFVLLGAGAAMGPLEVLLKFGANIIAIDLDREGIWTRLLDLTAKSAGTLIFPLKKQLSAEEKKDVSVLAKHAGANLFTQTPEIANWLSALLPEKEFVIGGYAYLDGELHVRVALAMDAIMERCLSRKVKPTLAFLCSPTDVFVAQREARDAMIANRKSPPFAVKLAKVLRLFSKRFLANNDLPLTKAADGTEYAIVDGIVIPQGPNYALAKRLQHWRAMLAWANGFRVSTNIAPSTATLSVVHNKQFAAAYGGFRFFPPLVVSYQETSNSLMGALLIHDAINERSKAAPGPANPVTIFAPGSCHFGIWRCGFKIGSIGEAATILFYLNKFKVALGLSIAGAIGLGVAACECWA
eukprot:m.92232 g.92232  ORF g.92232 m.92232 type:complete len:782 (-) comp13770_c4_seq1:67-2412(-)